MGVYLCVCVRKSQARPGHGGSSLRCTAPHHDRYSFDALKYDEAGVKHESFQAACAARGLLRDDLEWRRVLEDAALRAAALRVRARLLRWVVSGRGAGPVGAALGAAGTALLLEGPAGAGTPAARPW